MTYLVIKTVKGRRYRYAQRSWREGKRVRTESRYLGPADGGSSVTPSPRRRRGPLTVFAELIAANTFSSEERGRVIDEAALLREAKAADAARDKMRADFEATTGMRLGPADPVPIEKVPPAVSAPAVIPNAAAPVAEVTATESPAGDAAGRGSEVSE